MRVNHCATGRERERERKREREKESDRINVRIFPFATECIENILKQSLSNTNYKDTIQSQDGQTQVI